MTYALAVLPPLIERELQAALRKGAARRLWIASASIAGGLTILFLISALLSQQHSAGRGLFRWLFVLGTGSVAYYGLQLTADLFSEERREGTLGLLYLTGMSTAEIFASKLLVATLTCAYSVVVAVPFFAVPFLTGGVTLTDFLCALACLANGLLFCLALGTLASVLCREGSQAFAVALALASVLCLTVPAYSWIKEHLSQARPLDPRWLSFSPAAGPWMVYSAFTFGTPRAFWINSAVTFAYSVSALLVAGLVLHRTWLEGPDSTGLKCWGKHWQMWARGGAAWRKRLRRELLEEDPMAWLAARDRSPVITARIVLAAVAMVWVAGLLTWPVGWLKMPNFFATALLLHVGLAGIVVHSAAKCFGEERRSGGLELLLSTPLRAEQIVAGQWRALIWQFRGLLLALLAVDAAFLMGGLLMEWRSALAAVTYTVVWLFIGGLFLLATSDMAKRAAWISLWTGRPGFAAWQSARTYGWTALYLLFVFGRTLMRDFPTGSVGELIFVVVLLGALIFYLPSRKQIDAKLKGEFRLIAAEPIPDPKDKRFKDWNPERIRSTV